MGRNIVLNYTVQQQPLKGSGLQLLYINYDAEIVKDYDEVQFLIVELISKAIKIFLRKFTYNLVKHGYKIQIPNIRMK